MNAFETKVANAARLFLDRKGYSVIDIAWADPGGAGGFDIVAEDEVRSSSSTCSPRRARKASRRKPSTARSTRSWPHIGWRPQTTS